MFRVHRYHLDLESASFPRRPDSRRDPIPLVGVTKLEFESLLDFFYKSYESTYSLYLNNILIITFIACIKRRFLPFPTGPPSSPSQPGTL